MAGKKGSSSVPKLPPISKVAPQSQDPKIGEALQVSKAKGDGSHRRAVCTCGKCHCR